MEFKVSKFPINDGHEFCFSTDTYRFFIMTVNNNFVVNDKIHEYQRTEGIGKIAEGVAILQALGYTNVRKDRSGSFDIIKTDKFLKGT